MANFKYKARDKTGTMIMGTMEAASMEAVGMELGRMGHFPVSIKAASAESAGVWNLPVPAAFNRVKPRALVLFSRQMATLFNAGLPPFPIHSLLVV